MALVIRNDAGAELARAEDSPGTLDPMLEYAVPDKVTSIVVCVLDAQGRGGPRGIYRLPYAASKGGVLAMTKVLSLEYGGHGIRVNAVSPGGTEISDRVTARQMIRPGVPADDFTARCFVPDHHLAALHLLLRPNNQRATDLDQ